MRAIGVDVGGTNSRIAVVNDGLSVIAMRRRRTPHGVAADEWLRQLAAQISILTDEHGHSASSPTAIGIALPAVLDRAARRVVRSVNLPFLENATIADVLEAEVGRPVTLVTDADAATWGEYLAAGAPRQRFAHLRFGTGVACGFVFDGNLHHPEPERTTHLAILRVVDDAAVAQCGCGLTGCLETVAAGGIIMGEVNARPGMGTAHEDSPVATGAALSPGPVERAAEGIVQAIQRLSLELGVQTVVLGGGVWKASEPLRQHTHRRIRIEHRAARWGDTSICDARLGDRAGVIGAAQLAARASLPA